MIVTTMRLRSAVSRSRDCDLCTVVIINDATSEDPSRGNYDVRLYRRGVKDWRRAKPLRTGRVEGWPRRSRPAWILLAAAMEALESPSTRPRQR